MFQDSLTKKIAEAAAQIKTEPEKNEVNEKSIEGAVMKIMDEELKGNQHRIDANKNGKVDAHDFKLLRAQKEKEKSNSMKHGKDVKEETEEVKESSGASKEQETKFHKKLDTLVHKTFGKRKEEMKEETELDEALWPGTPEYEKKFPKDSKPGDRRKTQDYGYQGKEEEHGETTFRKEVKPAKRGKYGARQNFVRSRKISGKQLKDDVQFGFTDILEAYNTHGLKFIAAMMKEEPDNEQFTKEVEEQKKRDKGEIRNDKGVAKPFQLASVREEPVNPVREEVEQLDEIGSLLGGALGAVGAVAGGAGMAIHAAHKLASAAMGPKSSEGIHKGINDAKKAGDHKLYHSLKAHDHAQQAVKRAKAADEVKNDPASYHKTDNTKGKKGEMKSNAKMNYDTHVRASQEHAKQSKEYSAKEKSGAKISESTIDERTLSGPETAKKEEIVKSMKKNMQGFKERYGKRAKEVMYATATARAKENA